MENMFSSKSPRFPSEQQVLPPIVTNEKDRQFLVEVSGWLEKELSTINQNDIEQRYTVYRQVFSQIIEYVSAYRPLMISIKAQYEEVIDAMVQGRQEAFYLEGKLSEMVNAPGTLRNYQRRADDLQKKIEIVERDNERLREQLNKLRQQREERDSCMNATSKSVTSQRKLLDETVERSSRTIPGLSVDQATDVGTLSRELERVDRKHRELTIGRRTRYVGKDSRDQLKAELTSRLAECDRHLADVEKLRKRESLMRVAAEAAQSYLKYQLFHQTIGDAVLLALARASAHASNVCDADADVDELSQSYPDVDDDLDSRSVEEEQDADTILDYIEQFNELMEDQRYNEAALHAANGPRGVLRTHETMQRFADASVSSNQSDENSASRAAAAAAAGGGVAMVDITTPARPSPLLMFCSALMSTAPAFRKKPNDSMSCECVRCALEENRIDLIIHWLSQNRLTLSEAMGDCILQHSEANINSTAVRNTCLALAQKVFADIEAHVPAMVCMVQQGRVNAALGYAEENNCKMTELIQVLRRCPNSAFVGSLNKARDSRGNRFLPLGVIVTTLLQTDAYDVGLDLLSDVHSRHGGQNQSDDASSSLAVAMATDNITTKEEWINIARLCQERGSNECAAEILSSVSNNESVGDTASENPPPVESDGKQQNEQLPAEQQQQQQQPLSELAESEGD